MNKFITGNSIQHQQESAQKFLLRLQSDVEGFKLIAKLLLDIAGISLPENSKNRSLVASRLSSVLRQYGYETFEEYHDFLLQSGPTEQKKFISALTTNTTQFFREAQHFDLMRKELDSILDRKSKSGEFELRVWCAAASTGQEPISILISLLEAAPQLLQWNLRFLASDIDRTVLQKAANGEYSEGELESLPPLYRSKYFKSTGPRDDKKYKLLPQYLSLIHYSEFNLMTEPYPFVHRFDIVFCRNVMIYFTRESAAKVIEKMLRSMNLGGLLFLGHSESGLMRSDLGSTLAPAVYQRVTSAAQKKRRVA